MNRTLALTLCVAAVALAASTAGAQSPERAAPERRFAPRVDVSSLELPERTGTRRTLDYEQGLTLLARNSLDVQIARQAIASAAIIEDQARSIFVPTLNINASVTLNDRAVRLNQGNVLGPLTPYLDSVYDSDPGLAQFFNDNPDFPDARDLAAIEGEEVVVRPRTDYRAQAVLTQTLYNGRVFPARRLATIIEQQAHATVEQTAFQVQQAYTQLYFQAVALERFIDIARSNVDNARLTLEQATILFEERAGSEFDLTRAEVTYLTALRDYENAITAYELAIEGIATLIREEPDFTVSVPEELEAPASLDSVLDSAFISRPEILVADLDVQQYEARAAEASARLQPVIYASGQATYQRVTAFTGRALFWSVSLNASWDILDGGAARRERRTNEINARQAELRREQLLDTIRSEIRQAWLQMRNQGNVVTRAQAEAELAQLNYDLMVEARELGAASALEIDVAQNQLFQAQLALADAQTQYQQAVYELYRLQGNAWSVRPDLNGF